MLVELITVSQRRGSPGKRSFGVTACWSGFKTGAGCGDADKELLTAADRQISSYKSFKTRHYVPEQNTGEWRAVISCRTQRSLISSEFFFFGGGARIWGLNTVVAGVRCSVSATLFADAMV